MSRPGRARPSPVIRLEREPYEMLQTIEVDLRRGFRHMFGMPLEALAGVPGCAPLHDALIQESQKRTLALSPLAAFIQETFGRRSTFGPRTTFQQQIRSVCVLLTILERLSRRWESEQESNPGRTPLPERKPAPEHELATIGEVSHAPSSEEG